MAQKQKGVALLRSEYSHFENLLVENIKDESIRSISWEVVDSEEKFEAVLNKAEMGNKKIAKLQWDEYESINWEAGLGGNRVVSGYVMRKGLTRKADLASFVNRHVAKHPNSLLACHVPTSIPIELPTNPDRAAFLRSIEDAKKAISDSNNGLWMLKPSRIDRGDNKYLVSSPEEMEDVLWREREMLDWCSQRYIERPLLVDGRKFHIRVNVLVVGAVKVYVHRPSALVSTAALKYTTDSAQMKDSQVHISNSIFARTFHRDGRVHNDGTLDNENVQQNGDGMGSNACAAPPRPPPGAREWKESDFKFMLDDLGNRADEVDVDVDDIFDQICCIVKDLFDAAQMDPNALLLSSSSFELFGFDFMVEAKKEELKSEKENVKSAAKRKSGRKHNVLLLEVNAGCDYQSHYMAGFIASGKEDIYYSALKKLIKGSLFAVLDHPEQKKALFGTSSMESENKYSALEAIDAAKAFGWHLVHDGNDTLPPWMREGGFSVCAENGNEKKMSLLDDMKMRALSKKEKLQEEKEKNDAAGIYPAGWHVNIGDRFGYWSCGELVECICKDRRTAEQHELIVNVGDGDESTCPYGTLHYVLVDDDESDEEAWDSEWTDIGSERIVSNLEETPIGSILK
eukprot:g2817.t1